MIAEAVIGAVMLAGSQTVDQPTFNGGFSDIAGKYPEEVGQPVEDEHPNSDGSEIQFTTNGMLYWHAGISPTFTDGWHHVDLAGNEWTGESDVPLRLPVQTSGRNDPAAYIRLHSEYGELAVCVSRIETGSWTKFYNPTPHGRLGEHAQGYFGWLPSTFYGIATWGAPMNLDAEIDAFDRMLDKGRGGEFYGLGGYTGKYGTGPCFKR